MLQDSMLCVDKSTTSTYIESTYKVGELSDSNTVKLAHILKKTYSEHDRTTRLVGPIQMKLIIKN